MQTKQDGRLGTEKIGKLMLELALPSVLAQIVNVLYNIVDRIYIARIPHIGTCRKDPRKFYFPAALFFRASDGIFLCLSDTASVSLRRK